MDGEEIEIVELLPCGGDFASFVADLEATREQLLNAVIRSLCVPAALLSGHPMDWIPEAAESST
jgi:hypothetical protein